MPSIDPDTALHVVAGVLRNTKGEVFLTQRQPGRHQEGKWEFPGGKCERNEPPKAALIRELKEELGIEVGALVPRIQVPYVYPDVSILLDVFDVTAYSGEPYGAEGQHTVWSSLNDLDQFDYPAANLPVISSLRLPDCCAISNVASVGEKRFMQLLRQRLDAGLRLLQLRESELDRPAFARLARDVADLVHEYGGMVLLNTTDSTLVEKTGADGMHLNSAYLKQITERPLAFPFQVAASCHNLEEILHAETIQATFVLLSPVRKTRSHPGAPTIGWNEFAQIARQCSLPVYALGGMTLADVAEARERGAQGVSMLGAVWTEAFVEQLKHRSQTS